MDATDRRVAALEARVEKIETAFKELLEAMKNQIDGVAGDWGNPSLLEEIERLQKEFRGW